MKIRDNAPLPTEKLTAKDVAFTYNTLKSTSSVNDFTMLDSAEAVDDMTVVFHMKRAYSTWPYTMAIVESFRSTRMLIRRAPDRFRPLYYEAVGRGQQVIFEANPDYYGEAPKMKR